MVLSREGFFRLGLALCHSLRGDGVHEEMAPRISRPFFSSAPLQALEQLANCPDRFATRSDDFDFNPLVKWKEAGTVTSSLRRCTTPTRMSERDRGPPACWNQCPHMLHEATAVDLPLALSIARRASRYFTACARLVPSHGRDLYPKPSSPHVTSFVRCR